MGGRGIKGKFEVEILLSKYFILKNNQSGFTLFVLLFSIVLMGISISVAAKQWTNIVKREKEKELLFRGDAIKRAIELYYRTARGGMNQYPRSLEDLVKDTASASTKRYIRRLYKDPITNNDWVLVKVGGGRIRGVHSISEKEPMKKANFPQDYKGFEDKAKYSDWVFEFVPGEKVPIVKGGKKK